MPSSAASRSASAATAAIDAALGRPRRRCRARMMIGVVSPARNSVLERDPRVAARDAGGIDRRVRDALLEAQVRRAEQEQEREHRDEHGDRAAHDGVRDLLPARLPRRARRVTAQAEPAQQAADRQRVHPRPEHAQDRRQERQAVDHRGDDDDRAAEPDRASGRSPGTTAARTARSRPRCPRTGRPCRPCATARSTACSTVRPRASSSRNRLVMNSE